jgi:FlaA1/EpsC-like NDP-sugar epimerase
MDKHFFNNKRVAVTGACGTIGSELIKQLCEKYNVGELVGLDNNESELFFLEQRFSQYNNAWFFLTDIRDKDKLTKQFQGIDIVFHAAALKHVILCERSPFEAVQTNILGVRNVIDAAIKNNVSKVIFTSSDKAVNPTNVMGTSKLMGERLMTAANSTSKGEGTVFSSTRFGNVLGSNGSVIPIFREQIKKGGPITLTHNDMTRFIMGIQEAVALVIDSALLACGGEVFVTKMPTICIRDLAEVMIREMTPIYGYSPEDIKIELIGIKPGEKLYEELMNDEETARTYELENYFAVLPAFRSLYRTISYDYPKIISKQINKVYHSGNETILTQEELLDFLIDRELLKPAQNENQHPDKRYWP